jgi:HEAT repeat protein
MNKLKELLEQMYGVTPEHRFSVLDEWKTLDVSSTVEQLATMIQREEYHHVRMAIAEVLLLLGAEMNFHLVQPLLHDPDPKIRWAVCDLLAEYPTPAAVAPLMQLLLGDVDPSVRSNAVIALGVIRDPVALPALQRAIEHDFGVDYEDRTVSYVAAKAVRWIASSNDAQSSTNV